MTDVPRLPPLISERLITALVPVTSIPRPGAAPLPALPPPPTAAMRSAQSADRGLVLLATCQPDRSGRVNAAPLLATLAWQPGDCINIDVAHGSVVVTAARTGRHRIGTRGDIGLPAAVRAMGGLAGGQPVLLAALINHGVLAIHPAATITALLAGLHHRLLGDLHDR